jgi:cell filamentation protein
MDQLEAIALRQAEEKTLHIYDEKHRFTATDVQKTHKLWLGDIYDWAGSYRQVNLSKGDFPFAPAGQVPRLMADFEKRILKKCTPCNFTIRGRLIEAIAETHVEFVLIHPFREGNGRIARLLATLMGLQAGLPLLDFSGIRGGEIKRYFAAVQAGLSRDYGPMQKIFREVIKQTLSSR